MRLSDLERATLLIYVMHHGLPEWGDEADVLAALTGWPRRRAMKAMDAANEKGYLARKEVQP